MLRLRDLLEGVPGAELLRGGDALEVEEVRDDSRAVGPGDLFVAIPGTKADGRRFVAEALDRGATAILTERGDRAGGHAGGEASAGSDAPDERARAWIVAPSARTALGVLAANRYRAAAQLTLTAITGTNGKTTTSYLVDSILDAAGRRPGVIGTVGYRYAGTVRPAPLTTPGALMLHGTLAEMKTAGVTDVVMEATSIALDQGRLAGCRFRVAALSNITQDHLDYHGTMERYFAAKAILFRELLTKDGVAALFVDREEGRRMASEVRGRVLKLATGEGAAGDERVDVRVLARELRGDGTRATLATPAGRIELESALVGDFNLANIVLAAGIGLAHGLGPEVIARGIAELSGVPGRLERVHNDEGVLCVVDYAHTPDALERAIATMRPLTERRLVVVFGCGGDRDATKRPLMGEVAARGADLTVVTSDNPRSEAPEAIIEMILAGVRRAGAEEVPAGALAEGRGFHVEPDRRAAIRRAIAASRPGDTVLIAGKGHEDYQLLGARKIHFDDREEAAAAFVAAATATSAEARP